MSLQDIVWGFLFFGKLLTVLGIAMFVKSIIPYRKESEMLKKYEISKKKGEKPDFDAEYCHINRLCLNYSPIVVVIGFIVWLIGLFFEK